MNKKIFLLIALLSLFIYADAQKFPTGMKYQAVARDLSGNVLADQPISLEITLYSTNDTETTEKPISYIEYHQTLTNKLGLFTLTIGEGKVASGAFDLIPWSSGEIWMGVAIDAKGGNDYASISESKLLAVPYAIHALTASELIGQGGLRGQGDGNVWKVGGNKFNVPGPWVFGTLEEDDLVFITNNVTAMTITASDGINPGEVQIVGDLDVNGTGTFGDLIVENDVNLNTNLSGTTTIEGATAINDILGVTGETTLGSTLGVTGKTNLNDQVTITANITGGADTDFDQYPLRVTGGDHGVAIHINGNLPHRTKNFLTLFDNTGGVPTPRGRIESFTAGQDFTAMVNGFNDLTGLFPSPSTAFISIVDAILGGGSSSSAEQTNINNNTSVSSATQNTLNAFVDAGSNFNSDFGVGIVSGTLDIANSFLAALADIPGCAVLVGCDDLVVGVINLIHSVLQLGLHVGYFALNPGVAFESGGADYAEWLQKDNIEEMFLYGEIVGINGGMISKEFTDAEKYMVISLNPTVIGAMPNAEEENLYEKIAFMGQVPVRVIGVVKKGDYILPSGNGDGYAIAVNPEDMKARDYDRIVGIAWGESDGKKVYDYVNTAVGINANDMAKMIEQMQGVMNQLQIAMEQMNPEYKPFYYDVDTDIQISANYTTAPTLNEVIQSKINIDQYSSSNINTSLQEIKRDAIAQGVELNNFPYLSEILDDPFNEQLRVDAERYYTAISLRMQAIIKQMQAGG